MSRILGICGSLKEEIERYGHIQGTTKEIIGHPLDIRLTDLDLHSELEDIKSYYGEAYERRATEERFHYAKILYSLLHKVEEISYFFHQGLDSRKFIIFSDDCISSVQYLLRQGTSYLIVHMRSSDVIGLLPMDLWNLANILKQVDMIHKSGATNRRLLVTLGSAHYYLTGGRV